MAIFGYGRVSTAQQDTENQRLELEQAGWTFDFWFADIVSGKVQAIQRKAFAEMLGKKNFSKGVKVEVGEKEAAVDLYIIVEYGVRIPDIALTVQEKVKSAIENMTGLEVVEVNVHVQGVGFVSEEVEDVRVR